MNILKLALIHMNVRHKEPELNRATLMSLVEDAACKGAKILITPELAISGYSFADHADMAPFAETRQGVTLTALSEAAQRHGIHICAGIAEKDPATEILYNSAFVIGPDGEIVCRYRKINAESGWACPGNPRDDNTFETPWGRVGILICSDSYHGLMPRVTALRGADLLIIPANWPVSGLDPRELWRARALENGFHVAACNRTGVDLTMDCKSAPSSLFDPVGATLFDGSCSDSDIFLVDLPLNSEGVLDNRMRLQRLEDRRPHCYHDCYRNFRGIRDLTRFLELPEPGVIDLHCVVPRRGENPVNALESYLQPEIEGQEEIRAVERGNGKFDLYLLSQFDFSDGDLERINRVSRDRNIAVATCSSGKGSGYYSYIFQSRGGMRRWHLPFQPCGGENDFPCVDFGPARLMLAPFAMIAHPEFAVAAAKQGCDLILAAEEELSSEARLLAGVRTVENTAVAVCASNSAGIWMVPEGHQRWDEQTAQAGEACSYSLDTGRTRFKRFQDNIDFEVLLGS